MDDLPLGVRAKKRGQTLRDARKSTPNFAPDDAPHHAEHAPIFPTALDYRKLFNCASIPGLSATMKVLVSL